MANRNVRENVVEAIPPLENIDGQR